QAPFVALLVLLFIRAGVVHADPPLEVGPFSLVGDEPTNLLLGVGAFDLFQEGARGTQGTRPIGAVEVRFGRKLLRLGPLLGLASTGQGSIFGYGGLGLDAAVGSWSVLPAASIVGYRQGGGKELHSMLLFQAALTVARTLEGGTRVGITFAHVSNGYRHGTD